jgi:hypothetical protein
MPLVRVKHYLLQDSNRRASSKEKHFNCVFLTDMLIEMIAIDIFKS